MSTRDNIVKLLKRRKTGLTAFSLSERLPEVKHRTVINRITELLNEGIIGYDDFKYLNENDRYVTAYRAL